VVLLEILGEAKRRASAKGRGRLAHDRVLCTLCGGCAPLCPAHALTVHETFLVIDAEKCTACGACAPGCPTGALRIVGGAPR
jgi:ferredoxin